MALLMASASDACSSLRTLVLLAVPIVSALCLFRGRTLAARAVNASFLYSGFSAELFVRC